ncbi:MAG TPA: N-acetylmuramic acid 6-phosphate etherase [Candidatus Sumerlaeota bacterium]|nr:N-acetylmuramic acid 6-phosphate etherase [Candidatus Sumerlaeota bacterium]
MREEFEKYQNNRPCGACHGYRLKPEALAVKIAGSHIGQVTELSIREALAIIHAEDRRCVEAAEACAPEVARAIERVVASFEAGGRLFYVGAGTSGRLGVLDASEQPPTFGVAPTMVQGIIAGGYEALHRSVEGAEDDPSAGAAAIAERGIDARDTVCGITTGGRAPYVLGSLAEARRRGAGTILLTCTPPLEGEEELAGVQIHALVGPEVVTGSTRMKAGTVTKLILNQITTVAMIRIGKVYENLMVDVRPTNRKLLDRAVRIVMTLTGLGREGAAELLERAGRDVKVALVMQRAGVGAEEARRRIAAAGGHVARAIAATGAGE